MLWGRFPPHPTLGMGGSQLAWTSAESFLPPGPQGGRGVSQRSEVVVPALRRGCGWAETPPQQKLGP